MKKILSSFILTAILSGCGTNTVIPQTSMPTLSTFQSFNTTTNSIQEPNEFGLGCELDGVPNLGDDEASFQVKASLPARIDLRAGCSAISSQGRTGSCVGFATVDGLGEFIARKQGITIDFAPRFVWTLGRKSEKRLDVASGIHISTATDIIDNIGLVPEKSFPYIDIGAMTDPSAKMAALTDVPNSSLIKEAKKYRFIKGWQKVSTVHAMKKSLSDGMPVVFAIRCFKSIYSTKKDGIIPIPVQGDQALGGHALLCVGYDNNKRQFIIRNSWGTNWGDNGYGYLSYEYVKLNLTYEGFTAKIN